MVGNSYVGSSHSQVPNSSPSPASASSDMYGVVVLDACEQIKARMEPIASQNNFNSFMEAVLQSANSVLSMQVENKMYWVYLMKLKQVGEICGYSLLMASNKLYCEYVITLVIGFKMTLVIRFKYCSFDDTREIIFVVDLMKYILLS